MPEDLKNENKTREQWEKEQEKKYKKAEKKVEEKNKDSSKEAKKLEQHKKEVKVLVENSIKTISYLSFVIAIGLSIIVTVVLGARIPNLTVELMLAIVFGIFFSVLISFGAIITLIWFLYYKDIDPYKYRWKIESKKWKQEYDGWKWKSKQEAKVIKKYRKNYKYEDYYDV